MSLLRQSLEKEMTTHSSILVWKVPWMEELQSGLARYSLWGLKESDTAKRLPFSWQSWNGKECACHAGDPDCIPELGRFLGEGNGNPL